jgi:hypothetical protein
VEKSHAGGRGSLVGLVVRVKRWRRDPEVVLDAHGHARRRVVLEFRQRDVDVAVDVGMVQVVSREEAAAPGYLHLMVFLSTAQVSCVFVFNLGLQGGESVQVPAGVAEIRLERPELVCSFEKADTLRAGPVEHDCGREDDVGVDMIGSAAGQAKCRLAYVSRQVDFDRNGLAAHQPGEAAKLVHHCLKLVEDGLRVVRRTTSNAHR